MKKLIALVLALALIFSFAACAKTETATETPAETSEAPAETPAETSEAPAETAEAPAETASESSFVWNGQKEVWSILPTTGAEGLILINDAMGSVMEAEGFTYVKKDANGDPSAQVTFVEDAIAAGNVGCLMIAAMDVDMLQEVVGRAIDAGIAVAMLGADPDYEIAGNVYTAYSITGMFAVEAAYDWAKQRVAEGGNVPTDANGNFEVACDIFLDIRDGVYRSNAIVGTVDATDGLVRVSETTSYGQSAYSDAFDNAQTVLAAHPDCRIFIAYEPEEAMGAAAAIADYAEQNGLDLADFCVMPCYAEDTTFTEMYTASVADHSSSAIKGYSTYGDPAEERNGEVIIPPVLTGEHLADILLGVCGVGDYTWTYGETYFDTVTAVNVYGFEVSWSMGQENPAAQYESATYIG